MVQNLSFYISLVSLTHVLLPGMLIGNNLFVCLFVCRSCTPEVKLYGC